MVTLSINGKKYQAKEGETILEVSRRVGIEIPTLCFVEGKPPQGNCRLCVVEVKGRKNLVGSCHTPVEEGMVILTHSPRVLKARRIILELLLSSHSGVCFLCDKANVCELRKWASEVGIETSRFKNRKRFYPPEDTNPYVVRDLTKCILCRKCILACKEIKKEGIYGIGYRGFWSKIVVGFDESLEEEVCRDCEECVKVCPTGALERKEERFKPSLQKPLIITKD